MPALNLRPARKVVKDQHAARGRFVRLEAARETAMQAAIQTAAAACNCRLGKRAAREWVIDQ